MTLSVRPATAADAPRVAEIYRHYVTDTVITFETEPPPPAEWAGRISAASVFLVGEADGAVAGFAYATAWKPRAAYRFTGEDSIYLDPATRGRGHGRAMLDALVSASRGAGLRRLIATIADTGNPASVRLHRTAGFRPAGRLERVGWKFDRWIDVELLQLDLDGG
jgi:L-amino acid N-acyltransferase YncA